MAKYCAECKALTYDYTLKYCVNCFEKKELTCSYCGKMFRGRRNRIYCDECKELRKLRKPKRCKQCRGDIPFNGKEYLVGIFKCCSEECREILDNRIRELERLREAKKRKNYDYVAPIRCTACGKETTHYKRFDRIQGNFCSQACLDKIRYADFFGQHEECYLREARAILENKHWQGKNRCIKLAGD